MNCSWCLRYPSYMCYCSNIYLCDYHINLHLQLEGQHSYNKLADISNPTQNIFLSTKLNNWITSLKSLIPEIHQKTRTIIKQLENEQYSLITQLNSSIIHYSELLKNQNSSLSTLEELRMILSSEIIINDFTVQSLQDEIKRTYSINLYSTTQDPFKLKQMNFEKFLQNHSGGYRCLAISKTGSFLLSGSEDSSVRMWDVAKQTQTACLLNHKSTVRSLSISEDSSLAVSGSLDKSVVLWDLQSKKVKNVYLGHEGAVNSVAFTFDSRWVISGSQIKEIIIWKTENSEKIKKIIARDAVYFCLISPFNTCYLALGFNLEVLNLETCTSLVSLKAHSLRISSIAQTKNTKFIITGSYDKTVKVWENNSFTLFCTFYGHTKNVTSVAVTSDDKFILSSSCDNSIILWALESKSKLRSFSPHKDHINSVLSFNDLIFSASRDSKIAIFRISCNFPNNFLSLEPFEVGSEVLQEGLVSFGSMNDAIIWNFKIPENHLRLKGHSAFVMATCISPSMNFLLSASKGRVDNLIVWDLRLRLRVATLNGHQVSVFCVDVSQDERLVLSGDFEGKVRLWEMENFKQAAVFDAHSEHVYSVKFTKNGKFAASGGDDRVVCVWDVLNKCRYACFDGHLEVVWKVLVTGNDFFVSADLFNGICVWNIEQKKLEKSFGCFSLCKEWLDFNKEIQFEVCKYLARY